MTDRSAIHAEGLHHSFGDVTALDGLDLEVQAGTVFGLLGPNGAGKTTLVRVLATLLRPTAGRATVLGYDVVAEPLAVRRRIGLAGQLWSIVEELRGEGTTVLLTTQYLEEADRLAQRIAVVDHGRIVAQGTVAELRATVGTQVLAVRLADLAAGDAPVIAAAGEIRLSVTDPSASAEAIRRLDARGVAIAAVELRQPSLDDVFLNLTGRRADDTRTGEHTDREAA
jgi:ABC-2 type transport system ATP-binding protein